MESRRRKRTSTGLGLCCVTHAFYPLAYRLFLEILWNRVCAQVYECSSAGYFDVSRATRENEVVRKASKGGDLVPVPE